MNVRVYLQVGSRTIDEVVCERGHLPKIAYRMLTANRKAIEADQQSVALSWENVHAAAPISDPLL